MIETNTTINEQLCQIVISAIMCGYDVGKNGKNLQQAIEEFKTEFIGEANNANT